MPRLQTLGKHSQENLIPTAANFWMTSMKWQLNERIPIDRIISSSRPGLAYLMKKPEALDFYRFGPDEFSRIAVSLQEEWKGSRKDLCDALHAMNKDLGAGPATLSAIDRLRKEGTMAVVTGQQTAPLTGPYFTILKAATAVNLCRKLKKSSGPECVPVFWAEGDDHDVEEISRVSLGHGENALKSLVFEWPQRLTGGPIGDLALPLSLNELKMRAFELLPETEYTEEVVRLLFEHAGDGKTIGEWFASLMLSLFSSSGLIVAYTRHERFRRLWGSAVPRAIEEGPRLIESVIRAGARMKEAGLKPQIHKKPGSVPFFVIQDNKRTPVSCAGGCYRVGGLKTTAADLSRRLAENPSAFSAGVVLRPVIQDVVLPTLVYVGGMSEVSYFGQLAGVYESMGVTMPVVFPRLSATIVEPGPDRFMTRHSLDPSTFVLKKPDAIFSALVSSKKGLGNEKAWEKIREKSRSPLLQYSRSLPESFDPMKRYLDSMAGRIGHLVREAENRMGRELRSREQDTRKRVYNTYAYLYPENSLMERKLNIGYFMAKYGPGFMDDLMESMPEDNMYHYFFRPGGVS